MEYSEGDMARMTGAGCGTREPPQLFESGTLGVYRFAAGHGGGDWCSAEASRRTNTVGSVRV